MKPAAWVRNLTDPQPHCVTDLKYMSAADTDAGVQYVPLYEMILNKECYERGCAAYDDRVDEGVVLTNGGEHMKAFPNRQLYGDTEGMDLRDYFAAKAMQSFVIVYKDSIPAGQPMQDMAERAYLYADAMMEAREHRD